MKIKFLSILLLSFLVSCKSQKINYDKSDALEAGKYQVTTINGKEIDAKDVSLNFDLEENILSGYSGCNNFSSGLKLDKHSLQSGDARATLRYCEGNMEIERDLLKNLRNVDSYTLINGELTLYNKEGKSLIKANRMKEELKSGDYKVISVSGESVEKENLSLQINTEENRFSGNAGCNGFGSEYKVDGNTLEVGSARVTRMYCEGKMELEAKFLKNLKNVHSFEYQHDRLILKSKEGEMLIVAQK